MTVTATPVFVQAPKITPQNYVQGTDTAGTFKTICTAGANGTKVTGIIVNTTDGTAAHILTLQLKRSSVAYPLVNVTLPINSGADGVTPNIDILGSALFQGLPVDSDGQRYLFLESGDTLELTFATALTTSKAIYVHVIGANL